MDENCVQKVGIDLCLKCPEISFFLAGFSLYNLFLQALDMCTEQIIALSQSADLIITLRSKQGRADPGQFGTGAW